MDYLPVEWRDQQLKDQPAVWAALRKVQCCFSLEKVLHWMREETGGILVDVVVQDEYTHDVVIAFEDVYAVFDCT